MPYHALPFSKEEFAVRAERALARAGVPSDRVRSFDVVGASCNYGQPMIRIFNARGHIGSFIWTGSRIRAVCDGVPAAITTRHVARCLHAPASRGE
jgi:hypothetical protein